MDEPTAALGPEETKNVGLLVQELKKQGQGIFLISHDMHDVFALSDRITVMKSEMVVGSYPTRNLTQDDALEMIRAVGTLTGRTQEAISLAEDIRQAFLISTTSSRALRTAYFIWKAPWMAAGGDTFIQHMLGRCGLVNIFRGRNRYPVVELEELAKNDCELVLLSSEPYPFREKHIAGIRTVLPSAAIGLVVGEMFRWYGSRLLQSPAYFRQLRESLKN